MLGQALSKMKERLAALLAMVLLLSAGLPTVAFAVDYDEEIAKLEKQYDIDILISQATDLETVSLEGENKKRVVEALKEALACYPPGLIEEIIADANARHYADGYDNGGTHRVSFSFFISASEGVIGSTTSNADGLSSIALSAGKFANHSVIVDVMVHELAHGLNAYLDSTGITERDEIETAFRNFNGDFIYSTEREDPTEWRHACATEYGSRSYMEDVADLMMILHRHPERIANQLKNNDSILSKKKAYLERLLIEHCDSVQADTKIWKKTENSPAEVDTRLLTVSINGEPLKAVPIRRDGQVLVPLLSVFGALNCIITYETEPAAITGYVSGKTVKIIPDSADAYINGELVKQSVIPTYLDNGTVMVSARFIGEAFGANVTWDPQTLTVNINTGQ